MVSAKARTRRDEAGPSPMIEDVYSSLCGSSRFTRPSLSILRLRDHRSSRFNLGSDRLCLIGKNQAIGDDTNWNKKVTMSLVPSALWFASKSNHASHCHMFPHRIITVINDVIA